MCSAGELESGSEDEDEEEESGGKAGGKGAVLKLEGPGQNGVDSEKDKDA